MTDLHERRVDCPYCGETLEVLLNAEEAGQEYIEDCQVCCKPMVFSIFTNFSGGLEVSVRDENETF
ncbi:MAG: CPXCG motif-containing cysteine-rich protein [Gammaproteobacteria bacterium]|nr:CPXCG motif-containing cysteine-rich protein [Gammaproteobacteria bacterium]